MADHLADIRRYDALADEAVVERIVKHLGIALRNRDSSLVSCQDQKELDRVAEKWCRKKLRIRDDRRIDVAIRNTCMAMERDWWKSRVTFYYLVAKQLDAFDRLGAGQTQGTDEAEDDAE